MTAIAGRAKKTQTRAHYHQLVPRRCTRRRRWAAPGLECSLFASCPVVKTLEPRLVMFNSVANYAARVAFVSSTRAGEAFDALFSFRHSNGCRLPSERNAPTAP